jgi:hypothetical protein
MTVYITTKRAPVEALFLFARAAYPHSFPLFKSVSLTFNFDLPVFYLISRLMPAGFFAS